MSVSTQLVLAVNYNLLAPCSTAEQSSSSKISLEYKDVCLLGIFILLHFHWSVCSTCKVMFMFWQ